VRKKTRKGVGLHVPALIAAEVVAVVLLIGNLTSYLAVRAEAEANMIALGKASAEVLKASGQRPDILDVEAGAQQADEVKLKLEEAVRGRDALVGVGERIVPRYRRVVQRSWVLSVIVLVLGVAARGAWSAEKRRSEC
jgi:hypothetical protein